MGTWCWPGYTWHCLLAGMATWCVKHQRGRLFGLPGWRGYWAGVAATFCTTTATCCPLDPNAFTGVIDGGPPCRTRMAFSAATTSACIAIECVQILIACCLGDDAGCPKIDKLSRQQKRKFARNTFTLLFHMSQWLLVMHHSRTTSGLPRIQTCLTYRPLILQPSVCYRWQYRSLVLSTNSVAFTWYFWAQLLSPATVVNPCLCSLHQKQTKHVDATSASVSCFVWQSQNRSLRSDTTNL